MVTSTVLPKISATIVFLIILLLSAYPVIALESTTSATRKEAVKEKVEARIEAVKEKVETRKEKVAERIETLKEKMASREAVLKAKIAKFKDKKKGEAVERINTNLNQINQKQTEDMMKHLDKMSQLLSKLESRAKTNSSIEDAKTAISSASAAVKAQSEKDYSVTITSESTAKTDASKVRQQLHTDLLAIRKQVVAAKQAVATAIRSTNIEGEASGQ